MPQKFPIKKKLKASRPKKYGKVRPTKPLKREPRLAKPSTAELRSIYAKLRKSATWQIADLLAEAIQWFRRMCAFHYENQVLNPKAYARAQAHRKLIAQLGVLRDKLQKAVQNSQNSASRIDLLAKVINAFHEEVTLYGVKVPLLSASLKKAKTSAKKLDAQKIKVEKKFDSTLMMLSAAIGLGVELGAVPAIAGDLDFHYDSTLDKVLYSRSALSTLKKRIRFEGFLPVVLEQIVYIARAAAMREEARKTGRYLVEGLAWANTIARGMKTLCVWLATNPDAPNRLIKRTVQRKKRSRKKKDALVLKASIGDLVDTEPDNFHGEMKPD